MGNAVKNSYKQCTIYDAFKGAKQLLARNNKELDDVKKTNAICFAIDDWGWKDHQSRGLVACKAKDVIQQRLGAVGYASKWIQNNCGKFPPKEREIILYGDAKARNDLYQAWRHAWLDQLIAEFKNKKD